MPGGIVERSIPEVAEGTQGPERSPLGYEAEHVRSYEWGVGAYVREKHGVQRNAVNTPAQDGYDNTVIPEKQMNYFHPIGFSFLRND